MDQRSIPAVWREKRRREEWGRREEAEGAGGWGRRWLQCKWVGGMMWWQETTQRAAEMALALTGVWRQWRTQKRPDKPRSDSARQTYSASRTTASLTAWASPPKPPYCRQQRRWRYIHPRQDLYTSDKCVSVPSQNLHTADNSVIDNPAKILIRQTTSVDDVTET